MKLKVQVGSQFSAAYLNQTYAQQQLTVSEVATDWHEVMILRHMMWPYIVCAIKQLDPKCNQQKYHATIRHKRPAYCSP